MPLARWVLAPLRAASAIVPATSADSPAATCTSFMANAVPLISSSSSRATGRRVRSDRVAIAAKTDGGGQQRRREQEADPQAGRAQQPSGGERGQRLHGQAAFRAG